MTGRRALLVAGAALLGGPARAQTAPTAFPAPRPRVVTLLVGAAGGSSSDLWVRGFAPFLERHMKNVQVSVVNRAGEGGISAMRDLAEAPADGSVLAYAVTPFLLARAVERGATALLDRAAFLGAVTEEPVALVASPGAELSTLRASADGRPLALPPPVSVAAIAAAELAHALPIEQLHFPSAAAARQAAMAGNAVAALITVPEAMAAVREGRLALLAIAAPSRHPHFPDVPTLREAGIPLDAALRRGIAAPSRIDPARAASVVRALRAAAADPEFIAQAGDRGILPLFRDGPEWTAGNATDQAELRNRWETSPWPISGN